jgi:hypothetical protein
LAELAVPFGLILMTISKIIFHVPTILLQDEPLVSLDASSDGFAACLSRLGTGRCRSVFSPLSRSPEIDLSLLPSVPPVLPACAKAAPATAISMIAAQANVRMTPPEKLTSQ